MSFWSYFVLRATPGGRVGKKNLIDFVLTAAASGLQVDGQQLTSLDSLEDGSSLDARRELTFLSVKKRLKN